MGETFLDWEGRWISVLGWLKILVVSYTVRSLGFALGCRWIISVCHSNGELL